VNRVVLVGGRLSLQVEEAIHAVCIQTLGSNPRNTLRMAFGLLSSRLAVMGLERPSYSTFRRRARLWSMHGG